MSGLRLGFGLAPRQQSLASLVRNRDNTGAVAGSPGTLPTYWNSTASAGLTRTIVGTGTASGNNYIDIRYNGTSSSTKIDLFFESNTQIDCEPSQVWRYTVYLALVAGAFTNVDNIYTLANTYDTGGGYAGSFGYGDQKTLISASLAQFTQTITLDANVNNEWIQPGLEIYVVNAAAVDFTIRVGMPDIVRTV